MPFSFIRSLLFSLYFSNKIFLISEELHLVSSIPNVIDEREAANRIEVSNKKTPRFGLPYYSHLLMCEGFKKRFNISILQTFFYYSIPTDSFHSN